MAALLHRICHSVLGDKWHCGLLYVDDSLWIVDIGEQTDTVSRLLLTSVLLGSPLSWNKTTVTRDLEWTGYRTSLDEMVVGLSNKKANDLLEAIQISLDVESKIPFNLFHKLVARMSWWAIACPLVKPFLRTAYKALAKTQNVGMKKLGLPFDAPASKQVKAAKARWWVLKEKLIDDIKIWQLLISKRPIWKPKNIFNTPEGFWWRTDAMGDQKWGSMGGWFVDTPYKDVLPDMKDLHWFEFGFSKGTLLEQFGKTPGRMISALELLAVCVMLRIVLESRPGKFAHKVIRCHCDSMVAVLASGTWKAGSPSLNFVLREIAILCIINDVHILPEHLPGDLNVVADAISRYKKYPKFCHIVNDLDIEKKITVHLSPQWFLQSSEEWLESVPEHHLG